MSRLLLPLASSLEDFLLDDPYADLLNFSQPVEEEESRMVKAESSIASVSGPLVHFETISTESKEQQYWSELPIIPLPKAEEETESEKASRERWLSEVKSLIERQRGRAIWSDKSEKDIRKEKRSASSRLSIPRAVLDIVQAVHIDRTHTFKKLRKDPDFALDVIEYRRWMSEQRKKTSKDPLPVVKREVVKKWLLRSPVGRSQSKVSALHPEASRRVVILDEVTTDFFSTSSSTSTSADGQRYKISSSLSPAVLQTPSLRDWDKSYLELHRPQASLTLAETSSLTNNTDAPSTPAPLFLIDEDPLYLPNYYDQAGEDYYVVL